MITARPSGPDAADVTGPVQTHEQAQLYDSDRVTESALELSRVLSEAGEDYYLYGGGWLELALEARGVDYDRTHSDVDAGVARDEAIELLRKNGARLEHTDHPRESEFFTGLDRHGIPLEIKVVAIESADCETVTVRGQEVTGMRLELEYLQKKYLIARARRNGTPPREQQVEDVRVLEDVVDTDAVEEYVDRYVAKQREESAKSLKGLLDEKGLKGYREIVAASQDLTEDDRARVLSVLDTLSPESITEEVMEALDGLLQEYVVSMVKERYGL